MKQTLKQRTGSAVSFFFVSAFVVATCGIPAAASESPDETKRPETKRVDALGSWAYTRLNRAHKELGEERYEDAVAVLDTMHKRELNKHETAMMWQTYGYVYAAQDDYEKAARAFEECVALRGLPEKSQNNTRSTLAQVYMTLERYDLAIAQFETLIEETTTPNADVHYMAAMAYAHSGDNFNATPHAERAVALSDQPNEQRLQLLGALYFQQERFAEATPYLRELVTNFPKKPYWMQLSAAYWRQEQVENALGVQEFVFEQGLFDRDDEYVTLAQLLLHNGVPYEASQVLEQAVEKGVLDKDEAQAWNLMAAAYLQAKEPEKAVEPLERSAALAEDGEAYVRLAQIYLSKGRWSDGRRALKAGLRKGELENPGYAHLLLGIANVSDGHFDEAKSSFERAKQFSKTTEPATQWLAHVDEEMKLARQESEFEQEEEPGAVSQAD